jgi:hypothetical protein
MTSNRQIHAVTEDGRAITRYDRTGKWYVEASDHYRKITFAEAVRLATTAGSRVIFGRPGGRRFDAEIRKQTRW